MKFETDLLDDFEICFRDVGDVFIGPDETEWVCLSREYVGSRRWNEDWVSVFLINDSYWAVDWEDPSTEMQEDQGHWSYADEVEFHRVFPHKVERTIYLSTP